MPDDTQDLAAVESILTERDALQEWLGRLDAAGGSVPQSVRARVRVDYEHRLEAVVARLQQHTDGIAARLGADRNEHADLASRAQLSREALAEAELRHAVGEFDATRFEQERSRHVGDLESFELSLGAVAERIAKMDAIQQLIAKAPAPAAATELAAPPAPPMASVQVEMPDVVVASAPPEQPEFEEPLPTAPSSALSDEGKSVDDAFLAVFEAAEEESKSVDSSLENRGGLSFTPTGEFHAARESVVPPGSPPLGMPEPDQRPRFVRPATTRGSELAEADDRDRGTRGQMAALDVGTVELQPDPVLPEPAVDSGPRTLRCGECGAMNRPLEWYCEKCGAELTAG